MKAPPGGILSASIAALVLVSAPAAAQQRPAAGGIVYSLVGGGFGGGGASVATGVGAGLRLTPHLGLDVELTHLTRRGRRGVGDTLSFGGLSVFDRPGFSTVHEPIAPSVAAIDSGEDYPYPADHSFPTITIEDRGTDVTTLLTKFTVEFPVADGRLFPYFTGGGGVGRVTERTAYVIDPLPWIPFEPFGLSVPAEPFTTSDLGLSLVLGGGVDVRLWRGFGVGVDIRWLRVLRSYDADSIDAAQVTARASYRF